MKKILIVDDDKDILAMTKELLELRLPDAIIVSTNSAESAIDLIRNSDNRFHLVISDYEIDLSKMGGDRVAYAAKQRSAETMVMICSGALRSRQEEIMRCGADFYLEKPYYIDEFLCLVSQLLGLAPRPAVVQDCC